MSGDRFSLRRLARNNPKTVLLLWLGLCAWTGYWVAGGAISSSGDLDGLLPESERARADEMLVLLTLDEGLEGASTDSLLQAANRVREELGEERIPIAPPAAEVTAWLDAHALYLLPVERHEELQRRLGNDAITVAVDGLRARMSSPLFGVSGGDARRDPLGLRQLSAQEAGQFGHARAGSPAGAQVTAGGDLLSQDGLDLLLQLRSERDASAVLADIRSATKDMPVSVALVGPAARRTEAKSLVDEHGWRLLATALAGITAVLAGALRKVRPAAAVLLCLGSGVIVVAGLFSPLDPLALPLVVLLCGFGCEGGLHVQRISERGWPAALTLGTALAPLWLSPYPEWKAWSWKWFIAVAIVMALLRSVLPALLSLIGGEGTLEGRGFRLRPMRLLAVILTVGILGAGAWASETLAYRGADRIDIADESGPGPQRRLVEKFYDPALVVETSTAGADPADVLARAAEDARRLATLVPEDAVRVDSPGSIVLVDAVLKQRRAALSELDLRERLTKLREILETREFRPDAFGEFLRNATDPRTAPSPDVALEGPLGPWIRSYLSDDGTVMSARVHLAADPEAAVPAIEGDQGERLTLHGPAAAARRDRADFRDMLGVYALCHLWLGALTVWLGTRSLAIAASAAFGALVTQSAVLGTLVLLGQPLSPTIVPALLLVGAAAMIATGRACRAVDLRRPFFAMGLLVLSLCQVASGLALVATGVGVWVLTGLVVAVGAAIASGVGLFIAPGLTRLLRGISPSRAIRMQAREPASEDAGSES